MFVKGREGIFFLNSSWFYSTISNNFTLTYAMFEISIQTEDHTRFDKIKCKLEYGGSNACFQWKCMYNL